MKYKPQTKEELKELVADESIHLGDIDTTHITDMSHLFEDSNRKDFSGIEKWNVSNVENMKNMFYNATNFNQPLNSWNVESVTSMSSMFDGATSFNQPLDSWDTSRVVSMRCMFYGATNFNQPLNSWNVSNVENMKNMFYGAKSFNKDISSWNINEYCSSDFMFENCLISEEKKPQALQEEYKILDESPAYETNINDTTQEKTKTHTKPRTARRRR